MIGLLTPFDVCNYGTKLQAYAVQEICKEYGETKILRYMPSRFNWLLIKFKSIFANQKDFSDVKENNKMNNVDHVELDRNSLEKRKNAINSFNLKYNFDDIIVGYHNLKKHSRTFDAIICGSDQIWNPVNLSLNIYMLEFAAKTVRTISFAPSFGVSNLNSSLLKTYKKRIKKIKYLSVREESGCEIAKKLGRNDVFWCLDPTLVLSRNKWKDLALESKLNITEKYIFCYFLGPNSTARIKTKELSQRLGLKIINLAHFKSYCPADVEFADIDLYDVTPQDFIYLISHAEFICTDSFHGTAFSLIFEKKFFSFNRHDDADVANTNTRIKSLLTLLSLENRIVSSSALSDEEIDYSIITEKLNSIRNECVLFLKNAIVGDENNVIRQKNI